MMTKRSQATVIARRHGLTLVSDPKVAPVYGRWVGPHAQFSVTWHEDGWWAGLVAVRPSGETAWTLRTEYSPRLSELERLLCAARDGYRAELAEDAA